MSGEINVISRTQHVIVDPSSSSVAVINAGPQGPSGGPAGPPGPPGVVQGIGAGSGISVDPSTPSLPIVSISPTAWTSLTLTNGWIPETGQIQSPRYRKIGDLVYIEGTCQQNGALVAGVLATLPIGFRPLKMVRFMIGAHRAGIGGAYVMRGSVSPSGTIDVSDYSAPDWTNPTIYLSDIPSFSITA